MGIVKTLAHRAKTICHEGDLQTELAHLQGVFEKNGYPPALVKNCIRKMEKNDETPTPTEEEPIEVEKPKVLHVLPLCQRSQQTDGESL